MTGNECTKDFVAFLVQQHHQPIPNLILQNVSYVLGNWGQYMFNRRLNSVPLVMRYKHRYKAQ